MTLRGSSVKITDKQHDKHGERAFIYRTDGTTSDGDPIPDGWVEVVFDPFTTGRYVTELFRKESLEVCYC